VAMNDTNVTRGSDTSLTCGTATCHDTNLTCGLHFKN